ncbi:MAG: SDR family NAD(P)-dependent oxidoreductase [Syntrophomonadaceae bacterium]|jgi:NAD(P)-dependent dehydrogenase (short-subunit alcohol dehydrogenase family)
MGRLEGKVAVITGAGAGMGQATAFLFAKEGAKVVIVDYNAKTAEDTANRIKSNGGQAVAVIGDVSQWRDVDAAVSKAVETFGRLDIMINNAGVFDEFSSIVTIDDVLWDRIININLKGVLYGCKRAIQEFIKQGGGGVIINTASIAGTGGMAGGVAYTASKHGVIGLSRQVANEVARQNVRVNVICPGAIVTDMTKDMVNDPAINEMIAEKVPMQKWGVGDDIAYGMLYLASDESAYVTGQLLTIDGGWRSK